MLKRSDSDWDRSALLFVSQYQIDKPATANMRPFAAAVINNLRAIATDVYKSVGAHEWNNLI